MNKARGFKNFQQYVAVASAENGRPRSIAMRAWAKMEALAPTSGDFLWPRDAISGAPDG